jgi:exosome complex RNA-binding protein Rrp42 (RNase PH superfamily)
VLDLTFCNVAQDEYNCCIRGITLSRTNNIRTLELTLIIDPGEEEPGKAKSRIVIKKNKKSTINSINKRGK